MTQGALAQTQTVWLHSDLAAFHVLSPRCRVPTAIVHRAPIVTSSNDPLLTSQTVPFMEKLGHTWCQQPISDQLQDGTASLLFVWSPFYRTRMVIQQFIPSTGRVGNLPQPSPPKLFLARLKICVYYKVLIQAMSPVTRVAVVCEAVSGKGKSRWFEHGHFTLFAPWNLSHFFLIIWWKFSLVLPMEWCYFLCSFPILDQLC